MGLKYKLANRNALFAGWGTHRADAHRLLSTVVCSNAFCSMLNLRSQRNVSGNARNGAIVMAIGFTCHSPQPSSTFERTAPMLLRKQLASPRAWLVAYGAFKAAQPGHSRLGAFC